MPKPDRELALSEWCTNDAPQSYIRYVARLWICNTIDKIVPRLTRATERTLVEERKHLGEVVDAG
jgi:hypothetical protein